MAESKTPLCDQMRELGSWNPLWDPIYDVAPEWLEEFLSTSAVAIRKGHLDRKTLELIAVAVDASCTHLYAPGVRRHIRNALLHGATKEELLAVLQMVTVIGIHSMAMGVPILNEEVARLAAERAAEAAAPTQH
ncbi:MAG: carboxymuconolactone decarboxylase [bacterium]|nr:carboxymuconolactone decarboxylase [bacterium]